MRRRNAIWDHYRRLPPPTLFWAILQKNALIFAMVPEVLGGLSNPIAAQKPENRPEPNPFVRNSRHYRLPNRPELCAATRELVSIPRSHAHEHEQGRGRRCVRAATALRPGTPH